LNYIFCDVSGREKNISFENRLGQLQYFDVGWRKNPL
jgi:hypothetical protein